MPHVLRIAKDRKIEEVEAPLGELGDLDVMVALIQTLIPLGFRAAGGPSLAGGGRPGGPAVCAGRRDPAPSPLGAAWRGKLEHAYAQPTYAAATAAFDALRAELRQLNEAALQSLDEGLEETLTIHRLGVNPTLRQTLATTNMLESVFSLVEVRTGKVDRWRNSNQKHRWLAAALLDIEPRLRRVRGYRALPQLREALQKERGKGDCQRQRAIAS